MDQSKKKIVGTLVLRMKRGLKKFIVFLAIRDFLPPKFAEFLLKVLGLRCV
jgi:hypothetical protein